MRNLRSNSAQLELTSNKYPRHYRLLKASDYRRVLKHHIRLSDRYFSLSICNNQQQYPRLGLAIRKKVARHAVQRNRIKRIVREYFRQHQQQLPAIDIVVFAKAGIVEQTNQQLRQSLARHWQKLIKMHMDQHG